MCIACAAEGVAVCRGKSGAVRKRSVTRSRDEVAATLKIRRASGSLNRLSARIRGGCKRPTHHFRGKVRVLSTGNSPLGTRNFSFSTYESSTGSSVQSENPSEAARRRRGSL